MSKPKGLASNSLGALESAIMGIAGTAPAFTIAVTTAVIVSTVGVLSVGGVFYCGLIMFGIMLAYIHLNKMMPHAGAAYAWVSQVFGPNWGFFAGWGLLVASTVFMVSATVPAATSTLLLLAPEHVENTNWVTAVAALWLTLVGYVVTKGIKYSSYLQVAMTIVETIIIFALIAAAFIAYGKTPAHAPSLEWFSIFSFTPASFASAALIAIFFYWGWDVTMNLGEETKGGADNKASKGAFWAMVNLILFFIIMLIVVLIVLTDEEIAAANTNVLYAVADKLFPKPWSYLAVLSTMLSTLGTIETQILQFTRSLFAMSRDKVLHSRYAKIHPKWQTPWVATLVIYVLALALLLSSSYMSSVKEILESSVAALGIQICFYMGLTGFACAWHYRRKLSDGIVSSISYVIWPAFSALFMAFIALYSIPTFSAVTLAVGFGGLLIGYIPMKLNQRAAARNEGALELSKESSGTAK